MMVRINAFLEGSLAKFGSLFSGCDRRERTQRWEVLFLILLITAAALVRFWGLGSYGLHKPDEDTTALPAVHILEDGTARFPSGMIYGRAIAQSYLIAGSVLAFGQTEWALRLPSVLCGLTLIVAAYFLGRRFLTPPWNLAFVAIVAFLPGLIADSQEARMYIFLLTGITAFVVFVFQWERTGSIGWFAAALLSMAAALQFHVLAICSALIIMFPGVLQRDLKKTYLGAIGLVVILVTYLLIAKWADSYYPPTLKDLPTAAPMLGVGPSRVYELLRPLYLAAATLVGAVLAVFGSRHVTRGWPRIFVAALIFAGILLQGVLFYHVAILSLLAAVVIAVRNGGSFRPFRFVAAVSAVLAAAQIFALHELGIGSLRKIFGAMMGWPSIWTYLKTAEYSPVAAAALVVGLAGAFRQLMQCRRIADYWLFFLLSAWLPLLALGFMGWYFPPRYTEFALLPMLLCALAACQDWRSRASGTTGVANSSARGAVAAAAAAASIVFINPLAAARAVNAGDKFADHRGAAQYIRSIDLGPHDIVIAEEVLMQTYYLKHVDYWLYGRDAAAKFLQRIDGKLLDEYTHTPVISTAAEMESVLNQPDRGAIYIIGSGELQEDDRQYIRGPELSAFMQSKQLKVVFVGHDGLTKVWRIDPPHPSP